MKKIISLLSVFCMLFCLVSCNASLGTSISSKYPQNKKIIEVEAEEYGDSAYFVTKRELKNVSVNRMLYDNKTQGYSLEETIYTKDSLSSDECLRIVVDLQVQPYIAVKFTLNDKTYEQYLYRNPESGKMLLLELQK